MLVALYLRVDDSFAAYADGVKLMTGNEWSTTQHCSLGSNTRVLAVKAYNQLWGAGIRVQSEPDVISTNLQKYVWRCIDEDTTLDITDWATAGYDDSLWPLASTGTTVAQQEEGENDVSYIWTPTVREFALVYCRGYIGEWCLVNTQHDQHYS